MPNTHSKLTANRPITIFFNPVNKEQHRLNTELEQAWARLHLKLLEAKKREKEAKAALNEKLVSDIKRRLEAEEASSFEPDKRSREEIIRDGIDIATAENGFAIFIPKKAWTKPFSRNVN